MDTPRALKFASIWLLNPMVATISTRGSSEGLLGVMVVAILWAVLTRRILFAGILLGLSVHFKIYPFIYGISIIWYLEPSAEETSKNQHSMQSSILQRLRAFITPTRITILFSSLATFTALNAVMYAIYSTPFLTHTYLHHLTRIDHRHNFSPYNTLLHLTSAVPPASGSMRFESIAFIPQLALSAVFIPLALAKKDLAGTMLAQTFAFVAFNKVCTSQVRRLSYIASGNIVYARCSALVSIFLVDAIREIGNIYHFTSPISTYGHRLKNNRHPVRSAKDKLQIDQLVVGWVTTSEYWLLYVFVLFIFAEPESWWVGDELLTFLFSMTHMSCNHV